MNPTEGMSGFRARALNKTGSFLNKAAAKLAEHEAISANLRQAGAFTTGYAASMNAAQSGSASTSSSGESSRASTARPSLSRSSSMESIRFKAYRENRRERKESEDASVRYSRTSARV